MEHFSPLSRCPRPPVAAAVRVGLGLTMLLSGAMARAEPPACFPERTVVYLAPLFDDTGHRFGTVRAGHTLRVIANRVGEKGELAEVEVDGLPLRGRVPRDGLVVFPRQEISLVRDAIWLRTDAALVIESGDGDDVSVAWAEPHGETDVPRAHTTCANLVGTPPVPPDIDGCHGASLPLPEVGDGTGAHARRATTLDIPGQPPFRFDETSPMHMLARTGDRVLVDLYDSREPLRVRGTVAVRDLVGFAGRVFSGHMCCEAGLDLYPGDEDAVLLDDSPFRSQAGGAVLGRVPRGMRVRWLDKVGTQVKVAIQSPAEDREAGPGLLVHGFVPEASLPSRSREAIIPAIRGRLIWTGPPHAPALSGLIVRSEDCCRIDGEQKAMATTDGEGRFTLEFLAPRRAAVFVRSADGRIKGGLEEISVRRGGTEVEIPVQPATEVTGVVVTIGDVRLPRRLVLHTYSLLDDDKESSQNFETNSQGAFRLRLPAGPRRFIVKATPEFPELVHETSVPPNAHRIELRRPPAWLGRVARGVDGRCAFSRIFVQEVPHSYPELVAISKDCTFLWTSRFLTLAKSIRAEIVPDRDLLAEVPVRPGADPEPVCIGEGCQMPAAIWVVVANRRGVLASGAKVEATGDGLSRSCSAVHGSCFLHGLAPGQRLRLRAVRGAARGSIAVTTAAGIVDVVVRLGVEGGHGD